MSKDRERSIEEVLGCKEILEIVYKQYQEFSPLTETVHRGLHHQLLQYYPKADFYAGQYKKLENKVISPKVVASYISIDRQIEKNKIQYYKVLQQSSEGKFHPEPKEYNLDSLHWFFIKVLKHSIEDIYFYRSKYQKLQKLSNSAIRVLDSFKVYSKARSWF